MATAVFATDSENPLDNKVDTEAPNAQQVAPNSVPVAANGDPSSANPIAPTQATGEVSTSSADAQKAPAGAGPSSGSGPAASGAQSNIPGPGSAPATSAAAAGPGSQPATVPATATAPNTQVTSGANGASYVTPTAGTTLTAAAPDNSRFTDTTAGGIDRAKTRDRETGGKVYGKAEADSNIRRDAEGNIATNDNLTPEVYTQKTTTRSDGSGGWIVDYVKFGPNGEPMSPAEDVEGWNKLKPEQQEAAMREYLRNVEDWEKKQPGYTPELAGGLDPEFFDPEKFKDMPLEARKEAVKAWLEGKTVEHDAAAAEEANKPKITVNPDGSVSYRATDANGNPLNPWDDTETWKTLTQEQKDSLVQQATENANIIAKGGVPGEDTDYLGTGMRESEFKALDPRDQGWVMQNPGWSAPQRNADQSVTYTEKVGESGGTAHSYTIDKDGRKTSETWPAGTFSDQDTTFTYGADGSSTMTMGDTVIKRDSQGNDVMTDGSGWVRTTTDGKTAISAEPGTAAYDSLVAGYGPDGQKLTLAEQHAMSLGVRVEDLSPEQLATAYAKAEQLTGTPEGYAVGKTVGVMALKAGLITEAEFNTINNSRNNGTSWGAWLAANQDVYGALVNAGVTDDQIHEMAADSYFIPPTGMRDSDIDEGFFSELQQLNGYGYTPRGMIAPDALSGVDFAAISSPADMYSRAFENVAPGIANGPLASYTSQIVADDTLSPEDRVALITQLYTKAGFNLSSRQDRKMIDRLLNNAPGGLESRALFNLAMQGVPLTS